MMQEHEQEEQEEEEVEEEEEVAEDDAEYRILTRDEYKEAVAQAIVDDNLDAIPEITEGADPELEQEVKEALNIYTLEK
jgi:hypothetical protein